MKKFFAALFVIFLLKPAGLYAINFDSISWDIGRTDWTAFLQKKVLVTGDSQNPVKIRARASCDCIEVLPKEEILQPGEAKDFTIIFNPSGRNGEVRYSVFFETTDRKLSFINYILEAYVDGFFEVFFFYDENCSSCHEILVKLSTLEDRFSFKVRKFEISKSENFEYLKFLEDVYGLKLEKFPVLSVGRNFLEGGDEILKGMEDAFENFSPHAAQIHDFQPRLQRKKIISEFADIKFLPVLLAALSDGINPCAFAGIIFLVSYLTVVAKKKGKEVFLFGLFYTIGVGFFYFLFGAGILGAIKSLLLFRLAGKIFYIFMAVATLALSLISFFDAFQFQKTQKVILKVPENLMEKMRGIASKLIEKKGIVFYAFLTGGVVSVFEFVCTGQVYLPTISYIVSVTEFKPAYVFLLFVYAVFFSIPLFLAFLFVWFEKSSIKAASFLKKRIVPLKILNGVVFLVFAVWLFHTGVKI